MNTKLIVFFTKTPFLRLLMPLALGIIMQWYLQLPLMVSILMLALALICILPTFFINTYKRFLYGWVRGIILNIAFVATGMLLVFANDIRHNNNWFGKYYVPTQSVVIALQERPVEKQNSYKSEATVIAAIKDTKKIVTQGNIIVYFKKDSGIAQMNAGTQLVFIKPLQEIKNSGNPGGFDYKRYTLFNGITHQVYLTEKDFKIVNVQNPGWLSSTLIKTRDYVLEVLRKYIPGKKEQGLAEALLIGYKDDLDKTLLQSYTNTGVVHVIAVSGMHLTLLYWILNIVFTPLLRNNKTKWLHAVFVLSILWMFSLLTGGAASIIRAAVMFSFIMAGKLFSRNASIYNTLAASAFFLLCYNPYWLWDVGFQLSYAAVLSIVIFFKPIYHWIFFKNKIFDFLWKLVAVSIAAQILTLPFTIYHFHQFPVYFIITNLVAVPLSSGILIGELVLVILSPVKFIAAILGKILLFLIVLLNSFIERVEQMPFALWDGLYINILQAILLFIIIAAIALWFLYKQKSALWIAVISIMAFMLIRYISFYDARQQRKIIIYNVPKYSAVDIIENRNYFFYGDAELLKDDFLRNFHLKPTRTKLRLIPSDNLPNLFHQANLFVFYGKKILIINEPLMPDSVQKVMNIDLVILSKNPKLYIANMLKILRPEQIVIDGSVPSWKARYWKHDCDSLQIACFDVAEKGAFVMNLH